MTMNDVVEIAIAPYTANDEDAVVRLWNRCGLVVPANDPHLDISRKCAAQPDLFLVARLSLTRQIVGTVMAGYEGHRGWINYLAVDPDHQRQGIGRRLMAEAERLLNDLGCPKINLQVRGSNRAVLPFYERLGFAIDDTVSLGKRLRQDCVPRGAIGG